MRMPSSSARSCSSCSRFSSVEGLQRHEPLERRAAIGVHAEVMVERALAVGRGGAREVERPQPARHAGRRADHLDQLGLVRSPRLRDHGGDGGDVAAPCPAAGRRQSRTRRGSMAGRSPCRLRMISKSPSGSTRLTASNTRSEPETWSGARHDRLAAGLAHGRHDLLGVGCDHHPADLGRHGAPPHVHDHRLAGDVDQRLARQPRGLHAGGNDDERALHEALRGCR